MELYEIFQNYPNVSIDTRQIEGGEIYFALKGENFDGNQFVEQALGKGAAHVVCSTAEWVDHPNCTVVDDPLVALQELARTHREQFKGRVIGLTGSNGKTTSKELLREVIKQKFLVQATRGNLNNHIGVPLTLLELQNNTEVAIIEMGANHQKEIEFLCTLSQPDMGFITNYGKAHLEGFGGIEGIVKGKSELYEYLQTRTDTVVFYDADDAKMAERSQGINQRLTWSKLGSEADLNIRAEIQKGFVHAQWRDESISTQLQGLYNLGNIAYAVLIGQFMGIEDSIIAKGIKEYAPNLNRSQYEKTDKNELIVDCYNANPDSMEGALENLRTHQHDHKWAILGDMFELGDASAEEHRKTMKLALDGQFEQVVLVGEHFYREATDEKGLVAFKTTAEAREYLTKKAPEQKLVLIKGSRGMALEKLIPVL